MISLLDPSIATDNLGDEMISSAISEQLGSLGLEISVRIPTHRLPTSAERRALYRSDLVFVGGTNLLASNMFRYRQLRYRIGDLFAYVKKLALVGVGWWQYQDRPSLYTRFLLRALLNSSVPHSVRDAYSKAQLRQCGIRHVINTSCPTLWGLDVERLRRLPARVPTTAVTTLTDYSPAPHFDRTLIETLHNHFDHVVLWPQGAADEEYLRSLGIKVDTLPRSVAAFDGFLEANDVHYVGTRLHAGIRALQHGKRALVVAVDNRATEIARDIALPTVGRGDGRRLEEALTEPPVIDIRLPISDIKAWREAVRAATRDVPA